MAAPRYLVMPPEEWHCPNCKKTDTIPATPSPHIRYHVCPRLRFLSAPMVRQGTSAKVTLTEREDYINGEAVQLDPELGRPVMSVTTTRADGTNDIVVFAPTATAKGA